MNVYYLHEYKGFETNKTNVILQVIFTKEKKKKKGIEMATMESIGMGRHPTMSIPKSS